ncbi:class I SAM-dependent methyltransferase [Solibacillus sp. FSL W7-1436]|uniref:class I SAM-dependent methyltransferase n=1 Tax=Solibacillus sp. FSL W7-1436 TaxID=2921705 RepID=UPI0030F4B4FE
MTNLFDQNYYSGNSNYQDYKYDNRFLQWAYDIDCYLQPQTVLEVGCAMGYLVRTLRLLGIDSYGIDISSYAIQNADELASPYVATANATECPFQGPFDLIVAFDVLEHM